MQFTIRKLLIAVGDGTANKVVDRVAQLAGSSKTKVELFSVVRPVPPVLGMTRIEDARINRAMVDARRRHLEKLANRLRRQNVAVTCAVAADYSVTDTIVRRARRLKSELVAIEAHKHNLLARLFLSQTDYDLIRECPVPLLVVKGSPRKPGGPVLAALDPWHVNGKPKALDDRIIGTARGIAHKLGAALHSAHVYSPLVGFVGDAAFAPVAIPISVPEEKSHAASVRRLFKSVNVKYRIPPGNAHLQLGDPAFILPDMARELKAQMLVMGAVSRSAIKRILIGNTAERVLDVLPCDILIVKPQGFRTSVK